MFPAAEVGQDFLECFIHLDESSDLEASAYCASMQSELDMLLKGYIWQKEPLTLEVAEDMPLALRGKMYVGDNVEDEWVATAALNMLTKKHSNITVQVRDADGEFLLIEAAEALPSWLNPDNSANRVFLRRGHLHIVQQNPTERHMELRTALSFVTSPTMPSTRANKVMDSIVLDRLHHAQSYSMQREINCHVVQCTLPPNVALVFQALPHSVAYAVEAFYYREPTEATVVCRKMHWFPVPSTPKEMVTTMVPLTRCMYAQVKQQQFAPPKPFHHVMPSPQADASKAAAAELGMKLTCGLELLCNSRVQDWRGVMWRERIGAAIGDPSRKFEPSPLRPSDDDSWLYVTPEGLEAMLDEADSKLKELSPEDDANEGGGGDELQNMASLFDKFVHDMSDYEGVAPTESATQADVSFNMDTLMEILKSGNLGDDANVDDRASPARDFDDYFFDSEDEDDDVAIDAEMDAMMDEMDTELQQSKMAKSFVPPPRRGHPIVDGSDDGTIQPVDVDFNLVSNLLASVASQDGNAGPVSNILRDLGF